MNQEIPKTINRLTGEPFGYRDDSEAGYYETIRWTIDDIQQKAVQMGKNFKPNPEIVNQLSNDLEEGAIVLFDELDVAKAYQMGLLPIDDIVGLFELVSERKLNDIAVIPSEYVNRAQERGTLKDPVSLRSWLLTNNRC